MKMTEGQFISSDQENKIAYYLFEPEMPPIAVLQICHGMAEHILRYTDFAEYLCRNGVAVCGADHKGHGKSGGKRGDFGNGNALEVLEKDQKLLIEIIKKKYRHLPYLLFGHSMGSFVARRFITDYREVIDGVLLSGTAGPGNPVGAGIFLSKVLKAFGNKPSALINKIAFSGYNKRTGSDSSFAWLTRDEEVVKRYTEDLDCGFLFTANGYRQMFEAIKLVNSEDWADKVDKSLPIFILSGEEDPVGGYGKGVKAVAEALEEAEVCSLTVKIYPGSRHELLNELNKEEVYGDVLQFISKVADGVRDARMQIHNPFAG